MNTGQDCGVGLPRNRIIDTAIIRAVTEALGTGHKARLSSGKEKTAEEDRHKYTEKNKRGNNNEDSSVGSDCIWR